MASAKKETAEQMLLQMIETSPGAAPSAKSPKSKTAKHQSNVDVIKRINLIIVFIMIVSGALLAKEIFFGIQQLEQSKNLQHQFNIAQGGVKKEFSIPTIQNVSFYLANTNRRDIFVPYEEPKVKSLAQATDENDRIAKATQNLRLVGISWLDTVESASVMIEDLEKKVTYFLMRGEKIGDVVIKTIYADGVELGYENEEIIITYDKPQM